MRTVAALNVTNRLRAFKVVTPLLMSLFVLSSLEVSMRVYGGAYTSENFLARDLDLFHSAYPSVYHDVLGWIPMPGFGSSTNIWKTQVTILDQGIRSNGPTSPPPSRRPIVLAVGDSFTFGDEVSDGETWPALLERNLSTTVVNGGVFGFGLDQVVLRAEQLSETLKPAVVVVSFIADDIGRCALKRRTNVGKPYFEIVGDDRLALHNVPVPPSDAVDQLGRTRRLLGRSYAIHVLMSQAFPRLWLEGTGGFLNADEETGIDANRIACLLTARLRALEARGATKVLLMAQHPKETTAADRQAVAAVLDCARRQGLDTIDLSPVVRRVREQDPERAARLYGGHMTAAGNRLVADELAPRVRQLF